MKRIDSELYNFVHEVKNFYSQGFLDDILESCQNPEIAIFKMQDALKTELIIESQENNVRACTYIKKCLLHLDQCEGILHLKIQMNVLSENQENSTEDVSLLEIIEQNREEGLKRFKMLAEMFHMSENDDFIREYSDEESKKLRHYNHFYSYISTENEMTIEWLDDYIYSCKEEYDEEDTSPYFKVKYSKEELCDVFEGLCNKGWTEREDLDNWLQLCGIERKESPSPIRWKTHLTPLTYLSYTLFVGQKKIAEKISSAFIHNGRNPSVQRLRQIYSDKKYTLYNLEDSQYIRTLIPSMKGNENDTQKR